LGCLRKEKSKTRNFWGGGEERGENKSNTMGRNISVGQKERKGEKKA